MYVRMHAGWLKRVRERIVRSATKEMEFASIGRKVRIYVSADRFLVCTFSVVILRSDMHAPMQCCCTAASNQRRENDHWDEMKTMWCRGRHDSH